MSHKAIYETQRKFVFKIEVASGTWKALMKSSFLWRISMGMWENMLRVLKVYIGNGIGIRNAEGRRLLDFGDGKGLGVANTWFYKADKRKITFALMDVNRN